MNQTSPSGRCQLISLLCGQKCLAIAKLHCQIPNSMLHLRNNTLSSFSLEQYNRQRCMMNEERDELEGRVRTLERQLAQVSLLRKR